ncbi:MAG: DUF2269 domain-containing protein [Chloroflexota bacterium]|nr:DUF2269 domain-containing protein [Chloroflexota bacterium]
MDTSLLIAILLLIHALGAIVGFGPAFAFAVLGPMAGKAGPQGGIAIMEAMLRLERRLVLPVAAFFQPLSGVALIFVAGYSNAFFSHYWLWVAILIYIGTFYLAIFVQTPLLEKMIHMAKAGPPTPEFMATAKRTQTFGPIITMSLVVIIILMVVKPGG